MGYSITVITRDFGPLNPSPTLGAPTNMSKGKKFNTPKRFWRKMSKKPRPWYARQTWRKFNVHVMSKNHKKFKWFFRCKGWFKDSSLNRMSMRFPMSHEIWGWD